MGTILSLDRGLNMDWPEAKRQIVEKIKVGTDVNSKNSTLRKILETEHSCNGYDYNGETGFLVSIGRKDKLEIPWSMLEHCFPALRTSEGYNTHCFRKKYKRQYENKDCHVHVVGAIFEKSSIAYKSSKTTEIYARESKKDIGEIKSSLDGWFEKKV